MTRTQGSVSTHKHYARFIMMNWLFFGDEFTFDAAARVYLIPIQIPYAVTVDRICVQYKTPVAGNIRVGLYRDNGDTPVGGALLVESASVAKGAVNTFQEITIADTQLNEGLYWVAIQGDEATTVIYKYMYRQFNTGTLTCYFYDLGGYGAFTNPCPAVTAEITYAIHAQLRVKSIP